LVGFFLSKQRKVKNTFNPFKISSISHHTTPSILESFFMASAVKISNCWLISIYLKINSSKKEVENHNKNRSNFFGFVCTLTLNYINTSIFRCIREKFVKPILMCNNNLLRHEKVNWLRDSFSHRIYAKKSAHLVCKEGWWKWEEEKECCVRRARATFCKVVKYKT
jgi:hypothetical protein